MEKLKQITDTLREILDEKNQLRDQALKLSREAIRFAANSIRATHREEWDDAKALMQESGARVKQCTDLLSGHADLYFAGYTQDAQKEYAESELTYALVRGKDLKSPHDLGIEPAPYLNAIGEALGEMRRHILDIMRKGDLQRAERMLQIMDDAYFELISFDYPDAITNGLRRTTDMVRGVSERTRSDLTVSLQQLELKKAIAEAAEKLA